MATSPSLHAEAIQPGDKNNAGCTLMHDEFSNREICVGIPDQSLSSARVGRVAIDTRQGSFEGAVQPFFCRNAPNGVSQGYGFRVQSDSRDSLEGVYTVRDRGLRARHCDE